MPKITKSTAIKAQQFVNQYPTEFMLNSSKELFCCICSTKVKCDKTHYVESHRNTQKHQLNEASFAKQPKLATDNEIDGKTFSQRLTSAFLSADIPLKKIANPAIRGFFMAIGHPLPSESTCRNNVEKIHLDILEKVKDIVYNEDVFIMFDETSIGKDSYSNTLIGIVSKPEATFLVECRPLSSSLNAAEVCRIIDEVLRRFNIDRNRFVLLISDAARYMTAAGKNLKVFYPNMFHVTCLAHLLHNCCLKVRSFYTKVDKVISTIKAATVRNKERRNLFADIGYPPEPILTRWGSWLSAALYYAQNLVQVRSIFDAITGEELVRRAKDALNQPGLEQDLRDIVSNYSCLIKNVDLIENSTLGLQDAHKMITDLQFENDPCQIGKYIIRRLQENGINEIINMSNAAINPELYSKLMKCQATSCSVERSFSMLNKILAKDRNFKPSNIQFYIVAKFNSSLV